MKRFTEAQRGYLFGATNGVFVGIMIGLLIAMVLR